MHHVSTLRALGAVALAAALACSGAHAADGWAPTRTLQVAEAAASTTPVAPGQAVHVAVTLRLRDQAALDALTRRLVAGGGDARPLARGEFLARFAPTAAEAEAVAAHLRRAGFTNLRVAPNRLVVSADGTAATVRAAFDTELRHVDANGRAAFANAGDVRMPAALAGLVTAVQGLQTVSKPHTLHRLAEMGPAEAFAITGKKTGTAVPHFPSDFPAIYDATKLPPATGATLGIISSGDISQTLTDLDTFVQHAKFASPDVEQVTVGDPGFDTSAVVEWNLDSQTALSTAGGKLGKLVFYVGTALDNASLTEAYNQAVSDNVAQVINVSIGQCETASRDMGVEAADDPIFQAAVAQGQVFSVSTGDSGAFECSNRKNSGQSYPAVSPWVMAIGGTQVQTTGTTTWASETVWSCATAVSCNRDAAGGAGGGVSVTEPAPQWQLDAGVLGASTGRGVPDISFDADPLSGALIVIGTQVGKVGGTSLAAPIFSGFWARLQSKHGNTLGFPAAPLYQYGHVAADASAMFHDVTAGKNGVYSAGAGWDWASGFGSLDVAKFDAFISSHPGF